MNVNERIKILKNAGKSVFSADNLRSLWGMNEEWFKTTIKRMVDNGLLYRLSRGYYLFGFDVDPYELANTVVTPSYVSFNSALRYFDVNFQDSSTISSSASITHKKKIAGYTLKYHKIKDSILFSSDGVRNKPGLTIASPERAVLDSMYHNVPINIDRPDKINKTYLVELSSLYPKTVQRKAKKL